MKKVPAFIAGALMLVLAASCSTTGTVWDESVPPEQSADVWFGMGMIKSYNGITIDKKRQTHIVIPEGEANIGLDVYITHGGVTFLMQDMEITCYLEGGKEYTILGAVKDGQWGVNLYDGMIKIIIGNNIPNTILEFIPFENQPDTFK
jgi:hypothetical protein